MAITRKDILDAFNESHPFIDPQWTHCLFTGAPIAEIDSLSFGLLLDMLEGTIEERVESLYIRILNTSRPSPVWTMVAESNIAYLRQTAPAELLAYLRNGGVGLKKDKSGFHAMMEQRIESFTRLCGMDEAELESAFIEYYTEADRRAEEESRRMRQMQAWLESQTPEGKEAARRIRIDRIELQAGEMRINKWLKDGQREVISQKAKKQRERKSFFDSIFTEIMNVDDQLLKPVDQVLTQPDAKPAFRIAMPKKDS